MSSNRDERRDIFLQQLEKELKKKYIRKRQKTKCINLYEECSGMQNDNVMVLQPLNGSHEFPDIKMVIKTIIWLVFFYS